MIVLLVSYWKAYGALFFISSVGLGIVLALVLNKEGNPILTKIEGWLWGESESD